jgi:hypothetical protein
MHIRPAEIVRRISCPVSSTCLTIYYEHDAGLLAHERLEELRRTVVIGLGDPDEVAVGPVIPRPLAVDGKIPSFDDAKRYPPGRVRRRPRCYCRAVVENTISCGR